MKKQSKKETFIQKKKRTQRLVQQLKELYPDSRCSLYYESEFQLLIATLLSAQTTDLQVNKATPTLFKKFGTPEKMAQAKLEEIEKCIRTIGLFHTKARNCQKTAQMLCESYGGVVPKTSDALTQFPGVGRKTANVVLGNAFQIPAVVVDTHVKRIAYRLGLTQEEHPDKIEKDLEKLVDSSDWILFTHLIIDHGRAICKAGRPQCESCGLKMNCPQFERPPK